MLIYKQRTGQLYRGDTLLTTGYSGAPPSKNDPNAQHISNVGPIPQGAWWIGEMRDSPDHGPIVLPLIAVTGTETFGRSAFLMHGDSIASPGNASHGCIIVGRPIRESIADKGDKLLLVISGAV